MSFVPNITNIFTRVYARSAGFANVGKSSNDTLRTPVFLVTLFLAQSFPNYIAFIVRVRSIQKLHHRGLGIGDCGLGIHWVFVTMGKSIPQGFDA
ncbi:MAG: hypothetical protein HEQ35_31355 [Gloeotrichia echinulata IR180]|nr:hypothetical protein [Gloeotrichia echinulata DEX184]